MLLKNLATIGTVKRTIMTVVKKAGISGRILRLWSSPIYFIEMRGIPNLEQIRYRILSAK